MGGVCKCCKVTKTETEAETGGEKHKEQDYVGSPKFEANDRLRLSQSPPDPDGTNLSFKFWVPWNCFTGGSANENVEADDQELVVELKHDFGE
jgi:hypothetical protein